MYVTEEVGLRIKSLRKEKNMTQEELGAVFGSEASTICKIEKGLQAISIDYAMEISSFFGVTINYLLYGDQLIDDEVTSKFKSIPNEKKDLAKSAVLCMLDAFLQ